MKKLSFLLLLLTIGLFTWSCRNDDDNGAPALAITGIDPASGAAGTPVTITGTGFSTNVTENVVKFGDQTAVVTAATATSLTTTVPDNITPGNVKVTVTRGGRTATSASDFSVGAALITVEGVISSNTTWDPTKKYLLKGFVYVDNGATLTIQPGTIIMGEKASRGTLIVKRGANIEAVGTAQQPIVFTSAQPKGQRNYGDWGGLIILGAAPTNKPTTSTIEGEATSQYGGSDPADDSGTLKYVRIEFGGIAFATDQEINGLTLGGVGSGTEIDFVQISYSGDDAVEWFGGNVNAKHLVSYRTLDDDFDTDFGYSGNVQFGYILRDPNVADQCNCSDSNLFESDNDGSGSTATPQTTAKFANITGVVAAGTLNNKYRSALRIRRNSAISVYNSVFVGAFPKAGLELDGTASQANFTAGTSDYAGLVLAGMATPVLGVDVARFNDAARKNTTTTPVADLNLNSAYNTLTGVPNALPQSGSILLTGGVALPSGFEAAPYIGAFNTTNWTEGWTNFDPNNADY